MPNIFVTVPPKTFPREARAKLSQLICNASAESEKIPSDPRKRALCWVVINEAEEGALTCGAMDVTTAMIPCIVIAYVPAGVLDEIARGRFAELLHQAFQNALPSGEQRVCATSVIIRDVADGYWSANGEILRLPDFAKAAGYAHLQHLVACS